MRVWGRAGRGARGRYEDNVVGSKIPYYPFQIMFQRLSSSSAGECECECELQCCLGRPGRAHAP